MTTPSPQDHDHLLAPALLRAVPRHQVKIWGGRNLLHALKRPVAPAQRGSLDREALVGEAWEVADLGAQGESFIELGEEILPFGEARARLGAQLTHSEEPEARYPLLIKTLDAAQDLSIQVHPGEETLHLFKGHQVASKDECWVVLAAEPEGSILHGFKPGVTRSTFEKAVARGDDLSELLRRHRVQPGEVIHVPPGTIHAICAGVTLLEVQQPSDTTFRVWDYARPGLDGELRALHLEEAFKALNFGDQPPLLSVMRPTRVEGEGVLIEASSYRIMLIDLEQHQRRSRALQSVQAATRATSIYALSGALELAADGEDRVLQLDQGDLALCTTRCEGLSARSLAPKGRALVIEAL